MSAEAGRKASRKWDGLRPERPVPEGNECSALSTLSKSEEVVARAAARRAVIVGEGAGWSSRRAATTSSVGWTGGSCKSAAQARRPRGSAWRRERLQRIRESISGQIEIRGLAGFARGPGNGCPQVSSDIVEPIETSTPRFVVLAKGVATRELTPRG